MNLRYDMYGAGMEGDNRHAQQVMKDLGITYQHATPQSISDSWWFWNCENVPEVLPPHFYILTANPHDCIGWGLSKEDADVIVAGQRLI